MSTSRSLTEYYGDPTAENFFQQKNDSPAYFNTGFLENGRLVNEVRESPGEGETDTPALYQEQEALDPTPQGKSPESSQSSPRNILGAHFDIINRLNNIQFQSGVNGDGAMRGAIASIRKWKRGGTKQIVPAQVISSDGSSGTNVATVDPNNAYSTLVAEDLTSKYSSLPAFTGVEPDYSTNLFSAANSYNQEDINFNTNFKFTSASGEGINSLSLAASTPKSEPKSDQSKAAQFPVTDPPTTASFPVVPQPIRNSDRSKPSTAQGLLRLGLGALSTYSALRSANPWGSSNPWRSPNNFNKSLYLLNGLRGIQQSTSIRGAYFDDGLDSKARNSTRRSAQGYGAWESSSSIPGIQGEELWQFLFNPSELELECSPEFKNSETWGVSEAANSGQPLHWSNNKNAQLKFNSVLLNGYVFGKQVEDLEQGLIALFMSRDGEGQDGPQVLEFVWGSKTFGPCVIKNINIKEKQWDGGLVVNAEVSFTLEQIPEWTINDGFVDVSRPGRLPVGASADLPTTSTAAPATTPTTPTTAPPAAQEANRAASANSNPRAPKPENKNRGINNNDQAKCQRAYYWNGKLFDLRNANKALIVNYDRVFSFMQSDFGAINTELAGFKGFTTINVTELQREWDILSKGMPKDPLLYILYKGKYIEENLKKVLNSLGAIWNNKQKCPNTAGKSVK